MKCWTKFTPRSLHVRHLFLMLPVLLCACARFPAVDFSSGRYITSTGQGIASTRSFLVMESENNAQASADTFYRHRPGAIYPTWANEVLHQVTKATIPTDANSQVEANLLARRRAFDQAVQTMAERIGQLSAPETNGQNVQQILANDNETTEKVSDVIRKSIQITRGTTDEKSAYLLYTQINLEPIALLLWGQPEQETYPRKTVGGGWVQNIFQNTSKKEAPDILDQQAYDAAHRDAVQKMLHAIEDKIVYPGVSVEYLMRVDPGSKEFVLEQISAAKIKEVQYLEPGLCQVQLRLNLKKLMEQLKE